jgi:hypothetical protein
MAFWNNRSHGSLNGAHCRVDADAELLCNLAPGNLGSTKLEDLRRVHAGPRPADALATITRCLDAAETRSRISARSNSAIAATTWNIRRPDDVDRSRLSLRLMQATP